MENRKNLVSKIGYDAQITLHSVPELFQKHYSPLPSGGLPLGCKLQSDLLFPVTYRSQRP